MRNEQQINEYAGEYLRLVEVAEWLRVFPSTVSRWVKNGKIPAPIKWNGVVLFDVQAIRDAMKAAQSENKPVDGEAKNTESNTVTGTAGTQPTGKATEPEARNGEAGEALPELPKQSENKPVDGEAKNTESNTVTGTAGTQPTGKATEPEAHDGEAGEALPELPKPSENKPVDGTTGTQYREAI